MRMSDRDETNEKITMSSSHTPQQDEKHGTETQGFFPKTSRQM